MADPPLHLVNAARALERILNARDPENVHTVIVLPPEQDDDEHGGEG